MSGRSLSQSGLMAHRTDVTSEGEPLFTEHMSVQLLGPGSLGHTIPKNARDLLNVDSDGKVQIEIYEDGYFVTVVDDGDE